MACTLKLRVQTAREGTGEHPHAERKPQRDSKLEQMTEAETLDKDTIRAETEEKMENSRSQASKSEFHLTRGMHGTSPECLLIHTLICNKTESKLLFYKRLLQETECLRETLI